MSSNKVVSMDAFASIIHKILRSDRDVLVAVSGFTGEGKSTFLTLLQKKYAKVSGTHWDFNRMTWSRNEMFKWIDGEGESKKGQLPEYSSFMADELFHMFYRRNWYEEGQKDSITIFNMCRDRHLFVGGNVPDFWDLDPGFRKRVRFYVYIPKRGIAWVFEQENNPFTDDAWNVSENKKFFRRYRNPYKSKNFLFEIHFPDWDPEEKEIYYNVRNEKRRKVLDEKPKKEKYKDIKEQRDKSIRFVYSKFKLEGLKKPSYKEIGLAIGLSKESIRRIYEMAQ